MLQNYRCASPFAKAIFGALVLASGVAQAEPARGVKAESDVLPSGAIIMHASSSTPHAVAKKAGVDVITSASPTSPAPKISVETIQQPVELEVARKAVESYFNTLGTFQANFSQHSTGEDTSSEGLFSYKRPRMFVFQYDTPIPQKIVSTGTAVYYVDQSTGKDGQVTQLPMDAGVGRIFAAKSLSLKDSGLRVTEASQDDRQLRVLMVAEKKIRTGDQAGLKQVWLTFNKKQPGLGKLELASIEALDTLGVTTSVYFDHVKAGIPLSSALFEYTPGVYRSRN